MSMVDRSPRITHCSCRRFGDLSHHEGHKELVHHTLACLRARRGERSLAEYYGPPAPRVVRTDVPAGGDVRRWYT